MKHTLTQSEALKLGQRAPFVLNPTGLTQERATALNITTWVEKQPRVQTDADETLRAFIAIDTSYSLIYGINFEGKAYECGTTPRDLGTVIRGIAIARGLIHNGTPVIVQGLPSKGKTI